MKWLRELFVKKPEPEIAWHKERWMSRWDREKWEWRPEPGQPYRLMNCYANKAHAEESARWDALNIDCVSSSVTGPYPHKAGTCECWRSAACGLAGKP